MVLSSPRGFEAQPKELPPFAANEVWLIDGVGLNHHSISHTQSRAIQRTPSGLLQDLSSLHSGLRGITQPICEAMRHAGKRCKPCARHAPCCRRQRIKTHATTKDRSQQAEQAQEEKRDSSTESAGLGELGPIGMTVGSEVCWHCCRLHVYKLAVPIAAFSHDTQSWVLTLLRWLRCKLICTGMHLQARPAASPHNSV